MTKSEIIKIIEKGLESCEYNYTPEADQCYPPDLEGFNANDTYIELYDNPYILSIIYQKM